MIRLGIFARPPRPGRVKTRLIPALGADKATEVYRLCLEHTLEVARRSGLDYQLFLSETCSDEMFIDEPFALQQGGDLGARMHNALRELLAGDVAGAPAAGALIVGSDCLDLRPAHLRHAAQALANNELVLLPALDGGYALIGCREAHPAIFQRVDWGSGRVLRQTRSNARRLGLRLTELETVRDIDTLDDLEHYPQLLRLVASS